MPPVHATTTLGANDRRLLRGADAVIGVDEVGRGALAGPVVVCAAGFTSIPDDPRVRDSKELGPAAREQVALSLIGSGMRWAVCEIWVELIDRVNILESTRLAMASVIRTLASSGSVAVTDHVNPGDVGCQVRSPKKADRDYFSVAAASIVAKVHRDRLMVELARKHPDWAWQKNKGYGTVDHRKALQTVGPSRWHRASFRWSPVLP
jgi:ribonuclease HII